jgi:hypothetical protein
LASPDAFLNVLSRNDRADVAPIETSSMLNLTGTPVDTGGRYDALQEIAHVAR